MSKGRITWSSDQYRHKKLTHKEAKKLKGGHMNTIEMSLKGDNFSTSNDAIASVGYKLVDGEDNAKR